MDLRSRLKPPTKFIHSIRDELIGVLVFVGVIWVVFTVDVITTHFFDTPLTSFGLVPRSLTGLIGIFTMVFLHDGIGHILSNTFPLIVLLSLLAGSRAQSWKIVILISLIGGSLLWLFGSPVDFFRGFFSESRRVHHVGASLLIFGLITFLISSGYFERRPIPLLIAILVGFFYGTTLIWGVIPKFSGRESWDGHLCGGIAGVIVAYWLVKKPESFAAATKHLDFIQKTPASGPSETA